MLTEIDNLKKIINHEEFLVQKIKKEIVESSIKYKSASCLMDNAKHLYAHEYAIDLLRSIIKNYGDYHEKT